MTQANELPTDTPLMVQHDNGRVAENGTIGAPADGSAPVRVLTNTLLHCPRCHEGWAAEQVQCGGCGWVKGASEKEKEAPRD